MDAWGSKGWSRGGVAWMQGGQRGGLGGNASVSSNRSKGRSEGVLTQLAHIGVRMWPILIIANCSMHHLAHIHVTITGRWLQALIHNCYVYDVLAYSCSAGLPATAVPVAGHGQASRHSREGPARCRSSPSWRGAWLCGALCCHARPWADYERHIAAAGTGGGMYMRMLPIPRRGGAALAQCVFISLAPAPRGPGCEVPAGPSTRPSSARQLPEGGAGAWGGVIHNTSNGLLLIHIMQWIIASCAIDIFNARGMVPISGEG